MKDQILKGALHRSPDYHIREKYNVEPKVVKNSMKGPLNLHSLFLKIGRKEKVLCYFHIK